jgi:hypothetical protein
VTPDAGTTSILLYLYADGGASRRTINDYANVSVVAVQSLPHLALLGMPDGSNAASPRLVVDHTTYSDAWQGSPGKHVLVDGMLNGWLVPPRSTAFTTSYAPSPLIQAAQWVSLLVLMATLLIATRVPLNTAWHTIGRFVRAAMTTRRSGPNSSN